MMSSLPGWLHPYLPALLALAVALAGAVACRGKRALVWAPALGAAGALAGWAALAPVSPAALLAPRALPEFLLLPAAAALLGGLAAPYLPGPLMRWMPVVVAALSGWWLAGSPAGKAEFWRVWAAVGVLAWLLFRGMAGQASRSLAAGLALFGGLAAVGAPPVWSAAALVAAAAAGGLLAAGPAMPAAVMAAVVAGADLGAGRLVRFGLNPVDIACIAACGAPVVAHALQARVGKRWGRAGPVAAALAAAATAAACAWLATRLMRR